MKTQNFRDMINLMEGKGEKPEGVKGKGWYLVDKGAACDGPFKTKEEAKERASYDSEKAKYWTGEAWGKEEVKESNFRDPFAPRATRQPGEASVKAYKIPVGDGPYDRPDDKMLWAFASNQDILTINDISLSPDGQTIMVTPQWDDAYSEDDYESLVSEWGYFATEYDGSEYNDDGKYIGEAIDVDDEMDGGEQLAEDDGPSGVLPDGTTVTIKTGNVCQGQTGKINGFDHIEADAGTEWSRYRIEFPDGGHVYKKKHQFDIVSNEPLAEDDSPEFAGYPLQLNRPQCDQVTAFLAKTFNVPDITIHNVQQVLDDEYMVAYYYRKPFGGVIGGNLDVRLTVVDSAITNIEPMEDIKRSPGRKGQLGEDADQGGVLPDGTKVRIKIGNVDQGMEGVIQGQDEGDPDANTEWSRYWVQFIDGGRYAKKHQFDIVTDEPVVEASQAPNLTSIAKQLNASLASLGLDFKVTGKNPQGLVMTAPNSDDGWIYDTLGNSFEMHCEDILYKAGLKFGGFTVRGGPETTVLIKFTEGVEAPMEQLGEDDDEPYDIRKDGFREEGIMYAIDEDGQTFRWLVGSYNKMVMLLGGNPNPDGVDIHVSTHEECADRMVPEDQYGKNNWWKFMGMLDDGNIIFLEEIDQLMQDGTPGAELGMQALISSGSTADVESVSRLGEATVDRNPNVPSTQKMGGNAPTMNGAEIKQNQSADLGQDIMAKDEDGNEYDASYIERLKQLAGVK